VVGLLDLGNGLSRVEALGTNLGAVHDGLAPVEFEGVVELLNSLVGDGVSAVDDPSVRLQEHRRPEVP